MPVTAKAYGQFPKLALSTHPVDLLNDPIKVMLLADTYTPDQDNHKFLSDVVSHEITGEGYTAGGQALANKTLTYDAANNYTIFDAGDVSWPNATITARYAVLYADIGTSADEKPLLGYVDFGQNKSSENGEFTIIWNQAGIMRFSTP